MSSSRWSIASAKAELSRVVRRARRGPQILESRGKPVAVVLGLEDYERAAEKQRTSSRWRALLSLSAGIRTAGGATLDLPPRRQRRSPLPGPRR